MKQPAALPLFTLLLLISFASVNAVLFTPALPQISEFFGISSDTAVYTITWFLVGYTLGQLIYGPLANRFGRKKSLYGGISLQILSSLICVLSSELNSFYLLVVGRFFLALGSGVGLKMTFTLVNEFYAPSQASRTTSHLMPAFAIAPGLAVALGGFLAEYSHWSNCFYAGAVYGLALLFLVRGLPETLAQPDLEALKFKHLITGYSTQFKNSLLSLGGILIGISTSFVYIFAAVAPFVAINLLGLSSAQYGMANIIPTVGLISGSLWSAQLTLRYPLISLVKRGIMIASLGIVLMVCANLISLPAIFSIFIPMLVIYFGLSLLLANTAAIAMSHTADKAHGSAVMNFLNMGLATIAVLIIADVPVNTMTLPTVFSLLGLGLYWVYIKLSTALQKKHAQNLVSPAA